MSFKDKFITSMKKSKERREYFNKEYTTAYESAFKQAQSRKAKELAIKRAEARVNWKRTVIANAKKGFSHLQEKPIEKPVIPQQQRKKKPRTYDPFGGFI